MRNVFNNKFILFVCTCLCLTLITGSCQVSDSFPTSANKISSLIASATIPPTTIPNALSTPSPVPTATVFKDLSSALVSPADSIDFIMDYDPIDTWIDDQGIHTEIESFFEDRYGTRITMDCGWAPYTDTSTNLEGMKEVDSELSFGRETHVYIVRETAFMVFYQDNCRAEIFLRLPYQLDGDIDENASAQFEGIGNLIQTRLTEVASPDQGLALPSTSEVNSQIFDEVFNFLEIPYWGTPFRSYSVDFDIKKPFIKEMTLSIYDMDKQKFFFKRVIPNFPRMGKSHVDNLGQTVRQDIAIDTMEMDANYELYIWVEDDLVGIFPLKKYDS